MCKCLCRNVCYPHNPETLILCVSVHSVSLQEPLTLWQTIPHVEPVVLAVALSHQQGVVLQVEGQEREGDVHAGRGDDHVGALQVVRVLIRKPRRLDHAGGAGEIAEAEFRP